MKLLLAIVRDDFAADVTLALNNVGISVTRISTTGGFLRRGNVTLLIGVEEEKIDEALAVIDAQAGPNIDSASLPASHPPSRATVFVMAIDSCTRY